MKLKGSNDNHGYERSPSFVLCGDCRALMKTLADNSVDSVVCDPPYELGFMGKKWDSSGIAYDADVWAEALRVLKPGGHLIAFAGSRTYHRLAAAIEDAGFEIRDQMMWLYGSGFPKSHNVAKAIEAKARTGSSSPLAQRMAAMGDAYEQTPLAGTPEYGSKGNMFRSSDEGRTEWLRADLALTTEDAKEWQGWGTGLKPAHEPIVLARKPFGGSVADNILQHGTGALNIDGTRVPLADNDQLQDGVRHSGQPINTGQADTNWNFIGVDREPSLGRWPANVMHDGSDEILSHFPRVKTSGPSKRSRASGNVNAYAEGIGDKAGATSIGYREDGSAARFFYCAKASKRDRSDGNLHPTVKPTALMRYLCRLITPPGGVILDPFMGSGTTGVAALQENFRFVGIERDAEYFKIACARLDDVQATEWKRVA